MAIKILSGTYANGYTLAAKYTGVDVTSTGSVQSPMGAYPDGSAGVALTLPNGGTVIDHGLIAGGDGGNGQNASATYIYSWYGTPASGGGSGGAGIYAKTSTSITNLGVVSGGAGGNGGDGYSSGFQGFQLPPAGGGSGAAAIILKAGGAIINRGQIIGGTGGGGGATFAAGGADGGAAGAGILSVAAARIENWGLVVGGKGGYGSGGSYFYFEDGRGAPGAAGIALEAGGVVANLGTVSGGAYSGFAFYPAGPGDGVDTTSGLVVNGDVGHRTAVIDGFVGISLSGAGTVINFGTIAGVGYSFQGIDISGTAIRFASASDVLIAEGGSDFVGAAVGGGGALALRAGATGTIDGINGFGKVSFAKGASWVFQGDNEIPTGLTVSAGSTINVVGTLATFGILSGATSVTGELAVTPGKVLKLSGGTLTNLAAGVLTGGTFAVGAGALLQTPNDAPITTLDAVVELLGAKAGVQSLNTKTGREVGLRSTLTAIGATGVLEAAGGATLATFNTIANAGTIEALGGTITIAGAVSGTGSVEIGGGGAANFGSAFTQNLSFTTGAGELELGESQSYGGTISGLTAADTLDLRDIGFVSKTKASYSGTSAGGVLTVTDGNHTANLHLTGDYTASTWTLASDGHGGTTVVDPVPLAAAMASFGGQSAGAGHASIRAWTPVAPSLANPAGR